MIYLTLFNFITLCLAQAPVWRPITFKKLEWANANYCVAIIVPLYLYVVIRWVRTYHQPPTTQDIHNQIYSTDYFTQIKREYRINFAAFVLYQIIIVALTLIFL